MSLFLTNTDLLPVAAQLAERFIVSSEPTTTFGTVDPDRSIPHLALKGTDREFVAAYGTIAGHRGSLLMRVDSDGGVSMSLTLLVGLGGYSTTLLPEHVSTEAILAHAARAVKALERSAEKVKAERRERAAEMESATA